MAKKQSNSELKSDQLNNISADNPLTDPKTDRLGYAPFAKHFADSIYQMVFPGGFVVGIYGPWGSGKTTLLNFIIHYLKQKPEDEQVIIVPFNPWLFSGEQDITRSFFDQIQSALNKWKFVPKGLKDRVADFAKVISEIPLPYAQAGNAVARLVDDEQKDASDLKEEVENALEQDHPRIVVAIDDIGRLGAEDIKQLFRLLKAFPNFTDVVYILLFDKEVVTKALADPEGISGDAYLEKIIQVSFDLPLPDKTLLRRLLFEKLSAILNNTQKQLFDQTYWGNIYFQGIDHFITNIRDIVHLTDILSLAYPAIKDEVNSVDFIAIESLRVFCPIIYNIIRNNPKAFAGQADSKDLSDPEGEFKRLHNSWMAQVKNEDVEPVRRLLGHLFPKLEAMRSNSYSTQQESTWRRQLRVCSLEIFPIYFRLTLPEGELPDTEVNAILALTGDTKAFGENLIELANQKRPDGTTQVRAFLDRLEDYTEKEIPLDCIPSIVQALFNVGDQLLPPEDEPWGIFDFGNDTRIERITGQLLRRQSEAQRFEVLKAAMSNGNALATIVREVTILGQQQGKYGAQPSPEEEWLINAQHLEELEQIALKQVEDAAQRNLLLQTPALPLILSCWREWTSEEKVKQWVQKIVSDDEGLVDFLEKFLEQTFSQSSSDLVPKKCYKLDPKWIEPYIDPSSISDRVISLADESELTEEQTIAVKQFIEDFDMRQEKDLNSSTV